jgi:ABC-2 type transport system ATP-binding protein
MTAAIDCQKLSKCYSHSAEYALRELTLQVNRGEVYGFLGSNGAGKSTTIRLLLNFLQPSSGSATILGQNIVTDSVALKRSVGYLAGDIALYQRPTGAELLAYLTQFQIPRNHAYTAELAQRFEAVLDRPIGTLSKGQRQKIGLIQAFMHEPDAIILDEPTSGLDPLMQEVFFSLVSEHKQRGAAIFLSSHNLSEAQRICDRVGIIKHGQLIHEQTIGSDRQLGQSILNVTFKDASAITTLAKHKTVKILKHQGLSATLQPTGSISEALAAISKHQITSLETSSLNLEDEFMEFYEEAS